MLDRFVDAVLANVLSRELVAIASGAAKGHGVVHVVYVLLSPLSEVADKSVEVVALRHVHGRVLVVLADLVHQQERHVLVVHIEDETGA